MSYESEESWYIFKPFPRWYVTIMLFYVTTICCKRNQIRTREYIRWKNDLFYLSNKTNLRDLIAATGLVISLKLDSNRRFFFSRVTLNFDEWPRKIIGHLFYITSSFVHHLKPIGEFKLELLSGNTQFGPKSAIFFLSCVTLKFDGWPWKTIGHRFYVATSFVHHFIAIGEFKQKLQSGNTKFWSNSAIFCPVWPWNLTDDLEKQ